METYVVLIILFASMVSPITSLTGSFLAGIMIDIWEGGTLGVSSLIYCTIAFILILYQRKFNARHIFFLLIYALIVVSAITFAKTGYVLNQSVLTAELTQSAIELILLWILIRLWYINFIKEKMSD